jgi:hypothetical protein
MFRSLVLVLTLAFGADAFAEDAFVTAETPSKRFPDADTAGPTFAANTQVEVLVHDGARVRVRDGDDFGWIAATAISADAPDPMSDPAIMEMLRKQMGGMMPDPEGPSSP